MGSVATDRRGIRDLDVHRGVSSAVLTNLCLADERDCERQGTDSDSQGEIRDGQQVVLHPNRASLSTFALVNAGAHPSAEEYL